MSRFCVTTVTSGYFQHYLPIFAYTLRKNVPTVCVKTFHRGKLDAITTDAFNLIHDSGVFVDLPIEAFTDYPDYEYTTNCIRFLMPQTYFEGYDYVYITDADFIFLSHMPQIDKYYVKKLQLWSQCWWGRRGPRRIKKTKEVDKRVAGGGVLITQPWWPVTEHMRAKYKEQVMSGEIGKIREDDERMLWNMVAGSNLKCPNSFDCSRSKKYKELHIGDYKTEFKRWQSNSRMKKRVCRGNYLKWFRLEEDPVWQNLKNIVCKDPKIKEVMGNLETYMMKRKSREKH